LGPTAATSPAGISSAVSRWFRKSRTSSQARRTYPTGAGRRTGITR
jgi:hypothetical protein